MDFRWKGAITRHRGFRAHGWPKRCENITKTTTPGAAGGGAVVVFVVVFEGFCMCLKVFERSSGILAITIRLLAERLSFCTNSELDMHS
eukprot:12983139-Heterocapsa_arctica.AAC.1